MEEHWHYADSFDIDGPLSVFFVDYTVINGSDETLTNINAGGTDVDPYSYKDGVTLTNSELAALFASFGQKNVAAMADLTGDDEALQKKRSVALAGQKVSA